jgi:hypothetical protein
LQLGLGLKLATLALGTFVPADGWPGIGLVAASAILFFVLRKQRRLPPALLILALGVVYAVARQPSLLTLASPPRFTWPAMAHIEPVDWWPALFLLALPQLPLSLANSIYATERTAGDLFPHRHVTASGLAKTYAAMNLVVPLMGGIPVCHGAGGVAGHHAFGGRTGGSVLLCGSFFLVAGLFGGDGFRQLVHLLPLPTLGFLLAVESLAMGKLAKDVPREAGPVAFALGFALLAGFAPYGFGIALAAGTVLHGLLLRRKCDV